MAQDPLKVDELPVRYESLTDQIIPDRVVSYYEAPLAVPVLRRDLVSDERAALERRADHLRATLAPFGVSARNALGAAISEMLAGFPQMQRRSPSEAIDITSGYLDTLSDRPAWAIVEACKGVRTGKAGTSLDFAPSEARLNQMVGESLAPYRARLQVVEAILGAKAR